MTQSRSPRERTEDLEHASLSGWASLSADSKGREQHEAPDPLRSSFQVDVARILSSAAFARLADKSHVLLAPDGGGYRTRLEHTIQGTSIARAIARGLRLNEDLTEAIALGRDLGATAFARAGDEALSLFTDEPFRHSIQSVRVVEVLERQGEGLNLSWEVRDGIATHASDGQMSATMEGQVVALAARIAAAVGELRDALACGVLVSDDLPEAALQILGATPEDWMATLSQDAVQASIDTPEIRLSAPAAAALEQLAQTATQRVSGRHGVLAERARGAHCLSSLIVFYTDNLRRLPSTYRHAEGPQLQRVIDFVASLSDAQALRLFEQLFVPRRLQNRR